MSKINKRNGGINMNEEFSFFFGRFNCLVRTLQLSAIASLLPILIGASSPALAQTGTDTTDNAESRLDHYMKFAHPIGSARMEFPGPNDSGHPGVGGYTFIQLPTEEPMEWGDTVVKNHTYLLDLNVSHDGLYLAPDTMKSIKDFTPFKFILGKDRVIHADLAPGHTHEELLALDSNFYGCIGYGLIKQFITTYDFKRNLMTFYPLYSSIAIADDDSNALQLPIIDDAKVTYCGCPSPTIWLDVQAPPLAPGHVNLAFHEPQSQIFMPSLDSTTKARIDKQMIKDSLDGVKRPLGLSLNQFIVGWNIAHPVNFAGRGPRRLIVPLPPIYHDLSVPVLGTMGTDVLRTFSGIIIDPSRNKLIFIK